MAPARARRTSTGSGRPSSCRYSSPHLVTCSRARRCSPRATSAFTSTAVQSAWNGSRRSPCDASSAASAGSPEARAASAASKSSDWTQLSSRYRWSASQESNTGQSPKDSPSRSWPSSVLGSTRSPLPCHCCPGHRCRVHDVDDVAAPPGFNSSRSGSPAITAPPASAGARTDSTEGAERVLGIGEQEGGGPGAAGALRLQREAGQHSPRLAAPGLRGSCVLAIRVRDSIRAGRGAGSRSRPYVILLPPAAAGRWGAVGDGGGRNGGAAEWRKWLTRWLTRPLGH